MFTVRKLQKGDREALHRICLETSAFDLSKKNTKEFLFLMYNDYYTEKEPDFTFVACDEKGEVVGYILCAKNFEKYNSSFKRNYLPKIDKLGLFFSIAARSELFVHRIFSKKYRAHLHIDLTENCRRKGVGTALMNELKAELSKNGVHSLMLSCSSSNKAAVSFYEKNSFQTVFKAFGSNIMVCNF